MHSGFHTVFYYGQLINRSFGESIRRVVISCALNTVYSCNVNVLPALGSS